jgi:hypothetical protein
MSAYCRICHDKKKGTKSDVYVTCENCGSLVCSDHHRFWSDSLNAFCTVCFPIQGQAAVTGVSDAVSVLKADLEDPRTELYRLAHLIHVDSELRGFLDLGEGDTVLGKIEEIMDRLGSLFAEYVLTSRE